MNDAVELVLGFDISTSVIAISGIDPITEKLHILEFISLKKEKNLFDKALEFKKNIEKYKHFKIIGVAIEAPLVMFKEGFSRAQILSKLSMFNGMCSIITYSVFGLEPIYYNVNTARKLAFPMMKFPRGSNRKHIVWEHVSGKYPKIPWLYGPRSGKLVTTNYDLADATIISLAHIVSLNNQDKYPIETAI